MENSVDLLSVTDTQRDVLERLKEGLEDTKEQLENDLKKINDKIYAVEVLLNTTTADIIAPLLEQSKHRSITVTYPAPTINPKDKSNGKQDFESWDEYSVRMIKEIGETKAKELIKAIQGCNPSIASNTVVSNVSQSLSRLKRADKIFAKGSRNKGYVFFVH